MISQKLVIDLAAVQHRYLCGLRTNFRFPAGCSQQGRAGSQSGEDNMKMLSKLTIASLTVAALGAVAAHTIHAQVIAPVPLLHKSDAADAGGAKTYANWQGPLNQSFGA